MYVDVVAFGIGAQSSAVVSVQRSHEYDRIGVGPDCHVPAEALSTWRVCGTPVIVGGWIESGGGAMVTEATRLPLKKSPSAQPRTPGTWLQSVHCQNDQPVAAQPAAGTRGARTCQCAIQSRDPEVANTLASAIERRQKEGDE